MNTKELIRLQIIELVNQTKNSIGEIKIIAIAEVWKILQLLTATVIQVIEKVGTDLSGPDKKKLAMELIDSFYDNIFNVVDLPFIPNGLEFLLHSYIKKILMILVDSAIDAMVATFRDIGVFSSKINTAAVANVVDINNFLKNLNNIVRIK
jgi:hypothetical protein